MSPAIVPFDNLCTKFDDCSFSRSRDIMDMIGALQNLNRSHDMTTPLSGMVCRAWAMTCYDQSAYQICSFYLHPL